MNRRELLEAAAVLGLPESFLSAKAGAAPEPQIGAPDLVNLDQIFEWVSRQNPPRMSFLDPRWKALEEWKKTARPYFRELLRYNPAAGPVTATTLGREERDGFTIERVKISATAAYDIPAWVLVPKGRKGPLPGVVAIHCHGGCYVWGHEKILSSPSDPPGLLEYRRKAYGRAYTEQLVKRGYVVVVIDGLYFGSRRLSVEEIVPAAAPEKMQAGLSALGRIPKGTTEWYRAVDGMCNDYEHLTAKTIFSAGATWPGMLVWDDMRTVDYLVSRPDVDPQRIGCVGLSIGGLRTAHLIAADPRIKAACVTGWMTEFRAQLRNHLRHHTWMIYVPGLYSALDLPDAAAMTAPGALLVQQCLRDILYPVEGLKGAVSKLEGIYAKAGIPERFQGTFHDVPHSFTPRMQDEAFTWLDRWLR